MKKTIKDLDLMGKRVLLRVDFNVPLDDSGNITSDERIVEELPTIKYIIDKGGKLVICSHLGRPDGQVNEKLSLKVVADYLQKIFPTSRVTFSPDCIGENRNRMVNNLIKGDILVLENVRFHKEEEENDDEFSKKLAENIDLYVNDAFGTCHRKHSSTYGVAKLLPNAVGFLIEKELRMIVTNLENVKHPFVAILGGSKVSDKIDVINNLLDKVDYLLIGGGMAYTFIKSQQGSVGNSLVEDDKIDLAKEILQKAKDKNVQIVLPYDSIISKDITDKSKTKNVNSFLIPTSYMGLDIGKKARRQFARIIKQAKLVIWNGPMGVFEKKPFRKGTKKIAKALTRVKGTTIVGGGDTASAVISMGFGKKFTHISTGGGASLKLMEGKSLVCLDAIENK
jgi:phosphoglycerate kinase